MEWIVTHERKATASRSAPWQGQFSFCRACGMSGELCGRKW